MSKKLHATAASWRTKPMPDQVAELVIDGHYSPPEMARIERGFIPRDQQDKWFIYFDGEWLHFHRSWTGSCIFQLQLLPAGADGYDTETLRVNQDPAQYKMKDPEYNVNLVSYLVDHLLLNRFAQQPLPGKMSEPDRQRHHQHVMGRKPGGSIRLDVRNGGKR